MHPETQNFSKSMKTKDCFVVTALLLAAVLTLPSCRNVKQTPQNAAGTAALAPADTLRTDRITCQNVDKDSLYSCSISVDYPSDADSLSLAVRRYVNRQLANIYLPHIQQEENNREYVIYSGSLDDAKQMLQFYLTGNASVLREAAESFSQTTGEKITMCDEVRIDKTGETEKYVTYCTNVYTFLGGAHGSSYAFVANISKESCRALEQTVDAANEKALQPLLRKGVLTYLQQSGETAATDQNLNGYLLLQGNNIPLPATPPYLAADGVHFLYQQYEIAPYYLGMVGFTVPYRDIMPYLTPEAKALAE